MKPSILFVDDEPNVLHAYRRMLREYGSEWEIQLVGCPLEACQELEERSFDIVVSDIRMPHMTGLELLQRIKSDPRSSDAEVIIVTGEADRRLKSQALNLGATDLLNKPVNQDDLLARLHSAVRIRNYANQLKQKNEELEQRVRERTAALNASRVDILWRLGKAAEFRDEETGNHVIRVGSYSRVIAETMGLDHEFCETLFLAAPLHDIGKIGIPDAVLLKPGKLTDDEWVLMRTHCEIGVAILSHDSKFMNVVARYTDLPEHVEPISNPVIEMATVIAQSHHEKWNGTGYPRGLVGEEIPLAGRIVAIADVYDALRARRPYKQPFSIEKSLDILSHDAGTHFDPAVVEAFFQGFDAISSIESEFSDQSQNSLETPAEHVSIPTIVHAETNSSSTLVVG
ncbi:MAG: HD domain-containing phosphohydrolase [Rubripirellula sp.]